MTTDPGQLPVADQGLAALVVLLRLNGIGADPEEIRHRFGGAAIGIPEMLRCAKEFRAQSASSPACTSKFFELKAYHGFPGTVLAPSERSFSVTFIGHRGASR